MNLIKKILDNSNSSSPTDLNEMLTIPSAQLFLRRSPSSPKGELECICNDAVASIVKTSSSFNYQLIIQKAYEEDELDNDDGFEGEDDDEFDNKFKDEWEFLIDESLSFQIDPDNEYSISWRELNGDYGDRFQLIADSKQVKKKTVQLFLNTLYRCEYERKYGHDSDDISDDFLQKEFGSASNKELYTQFNKSMNLKEHGEADDEHSGSSDDDDEGEDDFHDAEDGSSTTKAADKVDLSGNVVYKEDVLLHFFDAEEFTFKPYDKNSAVVSIIDHGNFKYTLLITYGKKLIQFAIATSMNPVFDFDALSFVFNSIVEGRTYLLKFKEYAQLDAFADQFKITFWEALNQIKWVKVASDDQDYILNSENNLVHESESETSNSDSSDDESDSEDELFRNSGSAKNTAKKTLTKGKQKLFVDESDDDEDEEEAAKRAYLKSVKGKNTQMNVGYKNNRTFVSRGNNIGVFKEDSDDDDEMKFHLAIKDLKLPGSRKNFNPSKMMLHMQDQQMILQDSIEKQHLYRMDLEKGKIVDDFYVKEGMDVVDFNPTTKLSQLTGEQTFVGNSKQGIFKVDPRVSKKEKIVEDQSKTYATKTDLTVIATTMAGYLAVASAKGDIRLYDRLGINAKTQLPALGAEIAGLDLSKSGRYLLATCETHLLLTDLAIKDGKNAGFTGFQKSFGKDTKPRPIMLTLSPEHIASMTLQKRPLKFTRATFNIDAMAQNDEETIVTSTGPYVITWSMKKLLKGDKSYRIHHYSSNVVTENFKFGDDKRVIVALQDDVAIINKKKFKKPTRESLGMQEIVKDYY